MSNISFIKLDGVFCDPITEFADSVDSQIISEAIKIGKEAGNYKEANQFLVLATLGKVLTIRQHKIALNAIQKYYGIIRGGE